MMILNIKKRSFTFKLLWAFLFQVVFYFLYFIVTVRPVRGGNIALFNSIIVISCILGILWIIFLVDQIRYWLMTPFALYLLALIYNNPDAALSFSNVQRGGIMSFDDRFSAILIFILVFFAQCIVCIIKWIVKMIIINSKSYKNKIN
jgi:hypothetical protein